MRSLFFCAAIFLSACTDNSIIISQPKSQTVTITPTDIVIDFKGGRPSNLKITLNKHDITSLFGSGNPAIARADDFKQLLQENENFVRVEVPRGGPTSKFWYDTTGPTVHVTQVVESGNSVEIDGYVEDPSGIKNVSVNQIPISLTSSHKFSVTVPQSEMYQFEGEDFVGHTSREKYARLGTEIPQSMSVAFNKSGVNFVANEMAKLVASPAFGPMMVSMNPLQSGKLLLDTYSIDVVSAQVESASLSAVGSDVEPNTFQINGTFHNVNAQAHFLYDFWVIGIPSINMTGNVMVDDVDFSGKLVTKIENGVMTSSIPQLTTHLRTLRTDIAYFPDGLASIFYDTFDTAINHAVSTQLMQTLPPKMGESLTTFPKTLPPISVNGNKIQPFNIPSKFVSSGSNVNITFDTQVNPITSNGPKLLGSYWSGVGPVPDASFSSHDGNIRDVGMVTSQDNTNQMLASATQSGMLNITLTEQDIVGDLFDGWFHLNLSAIPTSAPFVQFNMDGSSTLTMRDFKIVVKGAVSDSGQFTTLLTANVDIENSTTMTVSGDSIGFEFVGVPRVRVHEVNFGKTSLDAGVVQTLMENSTLSLLPYIQQSMGQIPLPKFNGYAINLGNTWVDTPGMMSSNFSVVDASVDPSHAIPVAIFHTEASYPANAVITIPVSGNLEHLQYKFQVDNSPWSGWAERSMIVIPGAIPGTHRLTVCARTQFHVEDKICNTGNFTVK